MLSINTNVGAASAAQSSYAANKSMEISMNRLSSGKRINSATDDAAGIQIAHRMTAEIQGLNQSVRNAADAQAMLATAEGALEEVHLILLRIRELAVQSSNGTLLAADRDSLQEEVNVLEEEIQRIANDTTWAGQNLLNGNFSTAGVTVPFDTAGVSSLGNAIFQIGADNGQTVTIAIGAINQSQAVGVGGLGLSSNLSTATNARAYITTLDSAISHISTNRGVYGATMNRLDHAIANMQNVATNLATAKGRIEDADFAAETSNLARTQVLQQAAMSMLAQANASKQNVLALFQ